VTHRHLLTRRIAARKRRKPLGERRAGWNDAAFLKTGIALGSNLGDRLAQMTAARDFVMAMHEGGQAPLCSGLYETDPVDCAPGTEPFLNAVVEIDTSLAPATCLAKLRDFEQSTGRAEFRDRNSPRAIDLDLLYMGGLHSDTPDLQLPHPRMTQRRFVLQPLADIRPDLALSVDEQPITYLLARLPAAPAVRLVGSHW
jgi:2-amino-4-hydroxy-6-hydroxymethyldihydropteridine diphosphokinase